MLAQLNWTICQDKKNMARKGWRVVDSKEKNTTQKRIASTHRSQQKQEQVNQQNVQKANVFHLSIGTFNSLNPLLFFFFSKKFPWSIHIISSISTFPH